MLFVQAVVLSTPLAEGRAGNGPSAHVEADGTRTHYSHTEATCAFCSQHSVHSLLLKPARLLASTQVDGGTRLGAQIVAPRSYTGLSTRSRAPPPAA
jgi:Protein of unknown function (DUF2946)